MSKIAEIKTAQLTARKARDSITATLLTTIIGEAEMVGKSAGNRESTDEEVLVVLKKFEKNMLENLRIYNARSIEYHNAAAAVETELEIVRRFLPEKLTNLQVEKDIGTVMQKLNLAKEQQSLGIIVKELRAKYGDQFDGQQVSGTFKQMLV